MPRPSPTLFHLRVQIDLALARYTHPNPFTTPAVATGILLTELAKLLTTLNSPTLMLSPLPYVHALASIALVCQRTVEDLELLPPIQSIEGLP